MSVKLGGIPATEIKFPEMRVNSEGTLIDLDPVEDTTPPVDEVEDNETTDEVVEAPEVTTPEEEFDTIVYDKQEVKIPVKERQTYLQKGYNYDRMHGKLTESTTQLEAVNKWVKENYGEQGIDTWDAFQKALTEEASTKQKEELKELGVDEDLVKKVIEAHPALQEAVQKAKLYEEETQKRVMAQKMQQEIDELNERFSLDIKTLDDLVKFDRASKMIEFAKKGLSLADSYSLAYQDEILSKAQKSSHQKALNKLGGKAHLKAEPRATEDDPQVDMDRETLQLYQELNPSWSVEKIKTHYLKNKDKE